MSFSKWNPGEGMCRGQQEERRGENENVCLRLMEQQENREGGERQMQLYSSLGITHASKVEKEWSRACRRRGKSLI